MFALRTLKPDFRVDLRSVCLFHRSQWDHPGATSNWYLVYRLVMFMLVGGGVLLHILSEREQMQMQARWLLFLSHQSILLLAVHHFIYVVIVAHRRQSTVHQVTFARLSLVPASSISSYMELM